VAPRTTPPAFKPCLVYLSNRSPTYKRIGIIGNLAMLCREAAVYAAAVEGRGPGNPGASGSTQARGRSHFSPTIALVYSPGIAALCV
jgi:hypothetical protein